MRSYKKTKGRPYSIKKMGFKDENIDRQIVAIHQAMAQKVLANPELVNEVTQRLDTWRETGRIRYGDYIMWISILDLLDEPSSFTKAMTEFTYQMRKLRRKTPFIGILTEAERQSSLDAHALGELPDLTTLL
jgi:hypothetical protein